MVTRPKAYDEGMTIARQVIVGTALIAAFGAAISYILNLIGLS